MEKIHFSFIKDLRNDEFSSLFFILDHILEKHQVENTILKETIEKIKNDQPKLLFLKSKKPRHYLTATINKLVRKRNEYLTYLRMKVEANIFSHKPEERSAGKVLKLWLERYKKPLHAPSMFAQGAMVQFMMHDIRQHAYIHEAVTVLDLHELMKLISELTLEINEKDSTRIRDKVINRKKGKKAREAVYKDFQLFIVALELSYNLCKDDTEKQELLTISRKVKTWLRECHTPLKSRNTKKKNKKEQEIAVKKLISQQPDEHQERKDNLPMIIYK